MTIASHERPATASGQPPVSPTSAESAPSLTTPLLVWLLLQAAALLIAVGRVPLSAQYPEAGERLAIYVLLAAQVAGGAVLMPMLFRRSGTSAAVIATAWPFLAVAAVLSSVSGTGGFLSSSYVTLWLAVLALWSAALPWRKAQSIVVAVAVLWSVGGPILHYLQNEFAAPGAAAVPATAMHGPMLCAFAVSGGSTTLMDWIPLLICLLPAGIVLVVRRAIGRSAEQVV